MLQLIYQEGNNMPYHVLASGEEKDLEELKRRKENVEIFIPEYKFSIIDTENWNRKID
jgi:hypothetical protein